MKILANYRDSGQVSGFTQLKQEPISGEHMNIWRLFVQTTWLFLAACWPIPCLLSETAYSSLKWCWFMSRRNLVRHISRVQWTRQVGERHFIRLLKAQLKAHGVRRHQISPAEPALPWAVIGRQTYRKRYVLQDMIRLWSRNWPKVHSALPARRCSG